MAKTKRKDALESKSTVTNPLAHLDCQIKTSNEKLECWGEIDYTFNVQNTLAVATIDYESN